MEFKNYGEAFPTAAQNVAEIATKNWSCHRETQQLDEALNGMSIAALVLQLCSQGRRF
jgi:hypothetical protein